MLFDVRSRDQKKNGVVKFFVSEEVLPQTLSLLQTRIQVSAEYGKLGMVGTVTKISGDEGVAALWKGVNAAWLREASYTSLRLGLYEPIKVAFGAAGSDASFLKKFAAGSAAGALGSLAGSTSNLAKN